MSSGRLARILRLWLSFSSLPSLVFATCYCANEGGIDVCGSGSSPCPGIESASGVSLCCVPGDICGADSICHFNHAIAFTSGYYLGGCTDPTFTDPICAQQCSAGDTSDIVYSQATNLWSCCDYPNGTVNCEEPTSDTFAAISPDQFPGTSSSSSKTSTSTSTSTSSSTTSASSSSTSTAPPRETSTTSVPAPSQAQSSGLSTGAKAGIGVASAIGVIAIAALVVFLLLRRRRNSEEGPQILPGSDVGDYQVYGRELNELPKRNGEGGPQGIAEMDVREYGVYGRDLPLKGNNEGGPQAVPMMDARDYGVFGTKLSDLPPKSNNDGGPQSIPEMEVGDWGVYGREMNESKSLAGPAGPAHMYKEKRTAPAELGSTHLLSELG